MARNGLPAACLALLLVATGCRTAPESAATTVALSPPELWPEVEPFETGDLRVSDLHVIHYELSGTRTGRPVFVLHGGPGAGSSPSARRLFDPARWLIVQYDQRGAGKSTPRGELRENDTAALVGDIEKLRAHLKVERPVLFGGSWGTTLALAHAEAHPENVSALVLRGVFTATREEIDHFYHGGSAVQFPDAWARLLAELPDPARRPLPAYLDELLKTAPPAERLRYARAWARYEAEMSVLRVDDGFRKRIDSWLAGDDVLVFSSTENHYMARGCFLEEGQLLRDAGRLAGIRTFLVQGRYDVICPPRTAWELHRRIPGSRLVLAEASGHSGGEPEIQRALLQIFRELAAEPRG